jgi:hypothetical protein
MLVRQELKRLHQPPHDRALAVPPHDARDAPGSSAQAAEAAEAAQAADLPRDHRGAGSAEDHLAMARRRHTGGGFLINPQCIPQQAPECPPQVLAAQLAK